ncbi:MAG: NUDIX domain-containing protein [Patescibacteria group bacterium]
MDQPRPKVAVAVCVMKDGKMLLGRRIGNLVAQGSFGTPGGHVEHLESLVDAVVREVDEETGLEIENVRFQCVVNVREYAPAHYVMIVFRADWKSGEPQVREPDRCERWDWYGLDELPEGMTPATEHGAASLTTGQTLFE